jgi:TonB family protein
MQYADPTSVTKRYSEDLTAPDPLHADLPAGMLRARVVIACILDRSGSIKNAQVLESSNADTTAKIMGAISSWKFRPVLRGEQPVEVNAILGFNLGTS